MNILIYGIGGVGGYFGAKLANTNHHVSFLARGKQLQTIREKGIRVKSIQGDFHANPDIATDKLNKIPVPDLVLFCVKSWQLSEAAEKLKPYTTAETIFLPLQNGVVNSEVLMKFFSEQQILGGLCNLISLIESPGVIRHVAFNPTITFGELNNAETQRIEILSNLFEEAGIEYIVANDIQREIWKKFLFICTISGLGGLTRVPIGDIRESPYLYQMLETTANEILFLAQAKNINLDQKDILNILKTINNQDPKSTASTQRDLMEGRPSELETFNGYVVHEARKKNISVPVNTLIYECLLPMEQKARENYLNKH